MVVEWNIPISIFYKIGCPDGLTPGVTWRVSCQGNFARKWGIWFVLSDIRNNGFREMEKFVSTEW